MYEEPYRWIEAVGNRRQYLDDQFKQGSPIVGVSCDSGVLLLTLSRGTPKLYEIYDRIALGGMGHPADLEKLRFQLLDMAHLEGFNRSPSDVTGARLLKYGLAPVIKQAFEEIFKAPFITKILLAELGGVRERDQLLCIDYDGAFEEFQTYAVIAGTASIRSSMLSYLKKQFGEGQVPTIQMAVEFGLKAWAMGALLQQTDSPGPHQEDEQPHRQESSRDDSIVDEASILGHIRDVLAEQTLEACLLDRTMSGASKYRALSDDQIAELLPSSLLSA